MAGDKNTESSTTVNDIGSKTAGLKESILERKSGAGWLDKTMDVTDSLVDKTMDLATDISAKVGEGMDQLAQNKMSKNHGFYREEMGEKVLDTGEEFVDKPVLYRKSRGQVMEEGSELAKKSQDCF